LAIGKGKRKEIRGEREKKGWRGEKRLFELELLSIRTGHRIKGEEKK